MHEATEYLKSANLIDKRQQSKVLHKLNEIIGIDGKTQRGNDTDEQKANHIVSAVDLETFR